MFCDIMFFTLLFGNYSFMSSTAARFASVSAFAFLLRATKPAVVVLAAPPMLGVSCVGAGGLPSFFHRPRAQLAHIGGTRALATQEKTRHHG